MRAKRKSKVKELQFTIERGKGGIQFLVIPEFAKKIPIYDFRNLAHQVKIAKALAKQKRMAMFGGVWGAFKAVKQNAKKEDFFHKQIKPGRPQEAKVPLLARPKDSIKLIDWARVHPDFRFLANYSKFKKLWTTHPAFLHVIAPVKNSKKLIPSIFVTSPKEYLARYGGRDKVSVPTIAVLHRSDSYLDHQGALVEQFSDDVIYLGVSTLNLHGEEPPTTEAEFFTDIRARRCRIEAIDLAVRDRKYEESQAFGSHTQVRLPLVGETPVLKVVRIGSFSPEGIEIATGLKYEIVPGAKDVKKIPGQSLDEKLAKMMEEIKKDWSKEKPQIFFRS